MKPRSHNSSVFIWYQKDALAAARFYARTFPNSKVGGINGAPVKNAVAKKSDIQSVQFTMMGIPCIGYNGGNYFKLNEAFSFQITTDSQKDTDRYWNALIKNGGRESRCGWCTDAWGVSWQIIPRVLSDALAAGGPTAERAASAMMQMRRIDVAKIEAAVRGSV